MSKIKKLHKIILGILEWCTKETIISRQKNFLHASSHNKIKTRGIAHSPLFKTLIINW